MKSIIIALSILMGLTVNKNQTNNYDFEKAWIDVEKLINDGLPKSALEKVDEIMKIATEEKNDPQIVKSVVYISRLSIQTDEKGIEKALLRLQKIAEENSRPIRYITASYLAELYQRYFDNYRWEISQRSEIIGEKSEDFKTWSTQQFLTTIENWYLFSIKDKKAINIPIEQFKEAMNKYDRDGIKFRPTIYEALADRAFNFFTQYENYSNKNSESYTLDQTWHFDADQDFFKKEIQTLDKNSAKFKIISLYQDIINTQLTNQNENSLADYDLSRLEYVFNNSILEDKELLYLMSLEKLAKSHERIDFYTEIAARWAGHTMNISTDSMANVKALKICETAITKYPKSGGAAKCKNLIKTIRKPAIQLYGEQVYPSKNQLLFALDYNNTTNLKIETVRLGKDFFDKTQTRNQDEIRQYLMKSKKIHTTNYSLKESKLFKTQRLEFSHTDLPFGQYALTVTGMEKDNPIFQYLVFHVSDLAYTSYMSGGKRVFIVADRKSGNTLKGIKLALMSQNYNPSNRKNDFIRVGEYITDAEGKVKVNGAMEKNIKVTLSHKKDILDLGQFHYNYGRSENNEYQFAEFFTDRSLYRPGQVVYYKAILLKNDKNQIPSILPGKVVEITFRDANYQEISKQTLTSNDFGSMNGSFTIPLGKLNGMFNLSIQTSDGIQGQKGINVEEYKRPTFEVITDPAMEEYKLNDKVKISGRAQTLAGSAVDGSTFKYKVVRNARFPDWGWWWRMPNQSGEFIVKEGISVTDSEGKFDFTFEALPDLKISKSDKPIFTYRIDVEVTDQRGETRSSNAMISIGYSSFTLHCDINRESDVSNMKPLHIKATTLNGQKIDVKGKIIISQLKEPNNVQIKKYWDGKPDFPLPRPIAEKYFPQYPISGDPDFSNWPVAKIVYTSDFDTKDSLNVQKSLTHGVYKAVSESSDKNGEKVSSEQYFIITDFEKSLFPKSDFLFFKTNNNTLEPSDELKINVGSSQMPVTLHAIIEKDGRVLLEKTFKTDKLLNISFPITENHRGGINAKFTYIINNRAFEKSYHIDVPWTNKHLDITFETFRDKTLPGGTEEYRIKIKGPKKDVVAAEMVASMYDASLDQFIDHNWKSSYFPSSYASLSYETPGFNMVTGQYYFYEYGEVSDVTPLVYPALLPLLDYYGGRGDVVMMKSMRTSDAAPSSDMMIDPPRTAESKAVEVMQGEVNGVSNNNNNKKDQKSKSEVVNPEINTNNIRKNLKETVFFFPELKTDKEGNLILSFTMNEALTKWRLTSFAHTKDFGTGYDERIVQTQKNLMIFPNPPRFVRDGDLISFSAKVSNLSQSKLSGKASLQLFDAITLKDISTELVKSPVALTFNIEKGLSEGLSWDLFIPDTKYQAITYRIVAQAGGHSDGEENTFPVVTNRMLVTESIPIWIKGNETKSILFNAFKNNVSLTKKDFSYTFEFTSSPVWYAIQALPYMASTGNSGTLALMDRFYANALAAKIANAHPKIKAVMDLWQMQDKEALISNLSKNQELKSAILEETPWVRQAMSESEQKRNIAVLFDLNKMSDEKVNTILKLSERQLSNGGFPWFAGGRDDTYTTQNIMENIGHLRYLGALNTEEPILKKIVESGLRYMDEELIRKYERLKEDVTRNRGNISDDHLDELSIHYLYVRSFFKNIDSPKSVSEARDYYFDQVKKFWLKRSLYSQAMIGLVLHRNGDKNVNNVIKSLREKSFRNDELGMYWNEGNGFYWYQLPIERHALMIELFSEVVSQKEETDHMKIWLLKNKQTNHWKTSKSTSSAIFALLLQGENGDISQWVTEQISPIITIGKESIKTDNNTSEAGTGYFKKSYLSDNLSKEMALIKIVNNNKSVAWGAAYYQYFEQLDKITTFADTPLKINKKLYKVVSTKVGDQLDEITPSTILKPGDKLKVRIELRVDRQMEYVHMKDMRSTGFEPKNIISEYKYQGQLGYYETTKDLATHFYFSYLPKGTFVFEYPMSVVHKGDFSGGVTNIECMYAPEFSSHSEGIRVKVK